MPYCSIVLSECMIISSCSSVPTSRTDESTKTDLKNTDYHFCLENNASALFFSALRWLQNFSKALFSALKLN